jgi:hypothetical protein
MSSSSLPLPSPLEPLGVLCKGKLVNACGLGGFSKAHSKPGEHLSLSILKKSLNN